MDLIASFNRESYSFKIRQTSSSTYDDTRVWESLPTITSKNVNCDFTKVYTFKWTEKKKTGSNYLYIIPLAPYREYYSFESKKIKVSQTRESSANSGTSGKTEKSGLSVGAIIGIVFGGCFAIVIIGLLIGYCCNHINKTDDDIPDKSPTIMTTVEPIIPATFEPIVPVTVQPVVPVTVQPVVATYGPPPPQPYVHPIVY